MSRPTAAFPPESPLRTDALPAAIGRDDAAPVSRAPTSGQGGPVALLRRLDPRSLDDRPPALDFRLLLRGERRRGLLVARPNFLTDVGKALLHRRIFKRLRYRRIE